MPKTEIKPEFLSLAANNSFVANNSSPRVNMDYAHMSSALPLLTPDSKLIKSGIEYELAKYINHVIAEEDYIVKGVIPLYRNLGSNNPLVTIIVEFEKDEFIYLDYIDVPTYMANHSFFGYPLNFSEEMANLSYNSIIPKDTVLAHTNSYDPIRKDYKYGLNVNVAFMTHPATSEDGIVVSKSFCKRARTTSYLRRVINITKDSFPVNLYGDADIFKFLPNIGEKVREDGLLCALRERNDWFNPSDLTTKNISEPDMIFDKLIYVNPESIVVDIRVIKGGKSEFPQKVTEQLDYYADELLNYYNSIIKVYENYMKEKRAMYGSDEIIKLTPRMSRFITDCYIKVNYSYNSPKANKVKFSYRKLPIDQYRIEVVTMNILEPRKGFKLTDIHGAKGVICEILDDDKMPINEDGVRVDIISDPMSTISRMNLGRTYEAYLGAASRDNRNRLIKYFKEKYGNNFLEKMTDEDYQYVYKYLREFFKLINSDMVEFIDSLDHEGIRLYFKDIVENELYIYYPTDNEKNITDVVMDIENSIYRPTKSKLKYIDYHNKEVISKEDILVGRMYFMVLEKIGNVYNSVSSAKVNNFGFPAKSGNKDKMKHPFSTNPTKILGETEVRILTSYADREFITDMMDLALNPSSHINLVKHILSSEKAFDTNFNIDRKMIPYGNTKSLQILKHMFNAAGIDFTYEEEEELE